MEAIATEAGCAKGLINYHFGSKAALLLRVAERVRDARAAVCIKAMQAPGTQALDGLWAVIAEDSGGAPASPHGRGAESGRGRAWLALRAHPPTAGAVEPTSQQRDELVRSVARALALPPSGIDPILLQAGLEGIELRLLAGDDPSAVRNAWDRFWLVLLDSQLP